jgi:hypothetical protein
MRFAQGKLGNSAKIVDCTWCGNLDEAFANARADIDQLLGK